MSEKRGMTVQQLADRLTELCHQGKACGGDKDE